MKLLNNKILSLITLSLVLVFTNSCNQCDCENECDKINKRNLSGTWKVVNATIIDGESTEGFNATGQTLVFEKDGFYKDKTTEGVWQFGQFRNNLVITPIGESETFELNITEFSKSEMKIERIVEENTIEFDLVKE